MSWFNDFTDAVSDFTDGLVDNVTSGIDGAISWAGDVWDNVTETVKDYAAPVIGKAEEIYNTVKDNVSSFVSGAVDQAKESYNTVEAWITDNVNNAITWAKDTADKVAEAVTPDTEKVIAEAEKAISETTKKAKDSAQEDADSAKDSADKAAGSAGAGSTNTVTEITKWITQVLPGIDIPGFDVLLQLIPGFDAILKPLIDGVSSIGDNINAITAHVPGQDAADLGSMVIKTAGLGFNVGQGFSNAESNKFGSGIYDSLIASGAAIGALAGAPMGLLPCLMDAYSASLGQHVRNRASLISTPGRIGVAELATALWRGYIDSPAATRQAGEQGLDPDNFKIMIDLAKQLLGANEVITLMLRSEISGDEASIRLSKLGYDPDDIGHIKTLSQVIPNIQDLIRMSVREAFSPEIAEKFGQYEDPPTAVYPWAAKQGLSKEWVDRYWAAHWDLPGASMGFEMLHRGVIDKTELTMLLRALDVMPFWRDKLIQISYSPFTRVDIRRMHKLGILSDAEVKRAYQDIGYDDVKSDKLRDFTILLNTEEEKIEKAAERDLTLSMIKTAYQDGILADPDLASMVTDLGYDPTEAELIIGIEQYRRQLKIRTKEIEIIKARVMYDKIGLNSAIDQMNRLGLPDHEVKYQVLDLQLDLEIRDAKAEAAEAKKAATAAAKKAAAED